MAQFLTTIEINSNIEKLIKSAKNELILISPYIQLSSRNRKFLADQKNILKDGIHIVYRKDKYVLPPEEVDWLKTQSHIHPSTCENLHAKCYLNEEFCIISSLNLLDSSQTNNYEMGVLINKHEDEKLYKEAYAEAIKILGKSKEVNNVAPETPSAKPEQKIKTNNNYEKLTTYKLAEKLGIKDNDLKEKLVSLGYLEFRDGKHQITEKGKATGGEDRISRKDSNVYFLWSADFNPYIIKKLSTAELARKLDFPTNIMTVRLLQLGYLEARDKKVYLTEKGKLSGGELRPVESGYNCFWSENIVLTIEKINSVELAKRKGITTNEVIDKLVKSGYLKKEIGRLISPDKYYLTEKGINIGIEEKDSGSIREVRFIYPENIQF
jgi:hypothetical protein